MGAVAHGCAVQAKAVLGAKPPQPRFAKLIARAEKKGESKGEDTKSENGEKVEKAEKSKDKGSQKLTKVGGL